ncbi:hypothetical protein [Tessaracoccus caeni]|uniref:hypothetical protein n=1 Tax=Tessaracoccus caeni TaxID=3031239 RepID=UPI0023DCC69B|nr:hypothetical protein [Tessaracoccus caeni]MDF1490084.1 hypothetical protein [Tessaracoccus caeni]
MSRRVITKVTIDEALASGSKQCVVGERDIVTALAKEYAMERGVRLVSSGAAPEVRAGTGTGTGASAGDAEQVRAAVIAALGHEPAGLGAAIDKVLKG